MVYIDAAGMHYQDLNREIKRLVKEKYQQFTLDNINGQRYIADALQGDAEFIINGLPGNDLAIFMDGPRITVHGNVQDGAANTMNSGRLVIHGRAGDVAAYGMRGGEVYIRDDVGYRAGIHIKAYQEKFPVLVIGGKAGDFLGEYMAGGLILVLNKSSDEYAVGDYCGSGMHGGTIIVRGNADAHAERVRAAITALTCEDMEMLAGYVEQYEALFDLDIGEVRDDRYFKIVRSNDRPYQKHYVGV